MEQECHFAWNKNLDIINPYILSKVKNLKEVTKRVNKNIEEKGRRERAEVESEMKANSLGSQQSLSFSYCFCHQLSFPDSDPPVFFFLMDLCDYAGPA
jgi:hypothetical protein